jgi:hypothetical protein
MALAGPTRAGDQNGYFLVDESACSEVVDGGSIQTALVQIGSVDRLKYLAQ